MTVVMNKPADELLAVEPSAPPRFVRIGAKLLPDEIIAARRLARLKRRLGAAICALVVLLAAGYAYSWWQTSKAQDNLVSAQFQTSGMSSKLTSFQPLIEAQTSTTGIRSELATVMADDVQWSRLMANVDKAANGKVVVTSFTGIVGAAGAVANPLNTSGLTIIGTSTISGNASDYRSVAAFTDTLSTVKGLVVVDPASVAGDHGNYTFSVTLSLTTDALGGRFNAPPVTPAPATTGTTTGGN
jgi:Tfp pilus assembly protein PilN